MVVVSPTKSLEMVGMVASKVIKGIPGKVLPIHQGSTKLRGQTLKLKEKVLVLKLFPLARNMGKDTRDTT